MKKIAIECNNIGCLFLDRGRRKEATYFIEKGLNVVARSVSGNPLPSQDELEDTVRNIIACRISFDLDKYTSKNDKVDQQAGPSICRQSFPIFQPSMREQKSDSGCVLGDDDDDPTESMEYIASRLLYHRALALHLKANEGGKYLCGALQLYAMAKEFFIGGTHIQEDAFPMVMAILNNEANCHYEMFEFDLSRDRFEELCSMLDYHCSSHEICPDSEIESLCNLNCIIFKDPPSTARAA